MMSEITDAIKESVLGVEQQQCWALLEAGGAGKEWGLHTAASMGDMACVASLIERKRCDVNRANKKGWTALMYATYYGHDAVLQYLLRLKAKVNSQNPEGCTALMLACRGGHENATDILLQYGSMIEMTDAMGCTALFHAVQSGSDNVVRLLLARGANPDFAQRSTGLTPTMLAAKEGNESHVRLFLQWGANILCKDADGCTAYALAVKEKRLNVVAAIEAHFKIGAQYSAVAQPQLEQLLESIGVGKYYHVFEKEEIDFPMFLTLSDQDLQDIGIKLLGPRKKMCATIERFQNSSRMTPESGGLVGDSAAVMFGKLVQSNAATTTNTICRKFLHNMQ